MTEAPVIIVGAGPAGLMAAVALARNGIGSILLERRPDVSSLPRATAISTRSMELLRSWGLEAEVRAGGVDVEWLIWHSETLASAAEGMATPTGLPSRAEAAMVSPTGPACVPQDHLEPVLLRHLESLGVSCVAFGREVLDVEHGPDGVRVAVGDSATGTTEIMEARYLIAADGARSRVRRTLGIPMRGPDNLLEAVTVQFTAPLLWEQLGDRRFGLYDVMHPEAEGLFLPAGGDRWLYGVMDVAGSRRSELTVPAMARRVQIGAGLGGPEPRIERIGGFTFAAQLADRVREGDVFLVGDAAHRATPRGGTGMNTAIHDGYDLGWKLAWVLRGWAGPALLDSYERERRPVARYNVERSAEPAGTAREARHELPADLGGRIAHAWTQGGTVSTLDLLGPGLTLLTGPGGEAWEVAARRVAGGPPIAVRRVDEVAARALGVQGSGALLVRPDGAPAGWFASDAVAATALRAALATAIPAGGAQLRAAA
jgi:putative polyketide hydroxylase